MSIRELQQVIKDIKVKNKKPKQSKSDNVVLFEEPKELITNIDDTETTYNKLKELNTKINLHTNASESLETTLVGMFNYKEITHQQFVNVVLKYRLDIPVVLSDSKSQEHAIERYSDYYPEMERWDNDSNIYYSLFVKYFINYDEAIKPYDETDEDSVDYANSCYVEKDNIQLAEIYDDNRYLLLYLDKELIFQAYEGDFSDLENGILEHYNLDKDLIKSLYDQLQEQITGYNVRSNKRFEKRKKEQERIKKQKEKFDEAFDDWYKNYQPYSMGKYSFSDIWDEKGDIKNFKLWREMTDFVSQEKRKQYDSWKNYDFGKMFGNNTPVIKEEDKPMYKKCYKKLALAFHPDKGGSQEEMQFVNHLKEEWGI
jgi:hypothetical protein